ncbi:unnamed protein product [Prorocentrum cordatum]|uniref:Uncharacterized protein n=1 Tax=Prorocentrum cordatum TaxID=2364126 RepID=A0ABN9QT25_9DINO|nr:unnamed protein product [Polarella glacialis]
MAALLFVRGGKDPRGGLSSREPALRCAEPKFPAAGAAKPSTAAAQAPPRARPAGPAPPTVGRRRCAAGPAPAQAAPAPAPARTSATRKLCGAPAPVTRGSSKTTRCRPHAHVHQGPTAATAPALLRRQRNGHLQPARAVVLRSPGACTTSQACGVISHRFAP